MRNACCSPTVAPRNKVTSVHGVQGKYGDLDSTLVSYGPCQTPTLGFCVQRHDEIKTVCTQRAAFTGFRICLTSCVCLQFQPEPFWSLVASVEIGSCVELSWSRGRVFDVEVARLFHSLLAESRVAVVKSVKESPGKRPRPLPMNTVEMLKVSAQ